MSDLACTLSALFVHPVKSCAGIAVREAGLADTGLEFDREWMVVDAQGRMLTQREVPRLALVQPTLRSLDLVLRAPGMLALHLSLEVVDAPTRVQVWDDIVRAWDMGALAAQWMSDFLGRPARLARFDAQQERLSSARWTGGLKAANAFSDGYPLLVLGEATLAELNTRLAARGAAPVTMARFRPNLVLAGLQAGDEDHLHELTISADEGPVRLRLVKPCARCPIPDIDPATAERGTVVGDTLAGYRADARLGGAITFGMNAIVVEGLGRTLRAGQPVTADWRFE